MNGLFQVTTDITKASFRAKETPAFFKTRSQAHVQSTANLRRHLRVLHLEDSFARADLPQPFERALTAFLNNCGHNRFGNSIYIFLSLSL